MGTGGTAGRADEAQGGKAPAFMIPVRVRGSRDQGTFCTCDMLLLSVT